MSKNQRAKTGLTLGDFILSMYDACGEKAATIIWYALNANMVKLAPCRLPARRHHRQIAHKRQVHASPRPLPSSSARGKMAFPTMALAI